MKYSTCIFLSLYTATRPHGHSRQVFASSGISIRQKIHWWKIGKHIASNECVIVQDNKNTARGCQRSTAAAFRKF